MKLFNVFAMILLCSSSIIFSMDDSSKGPKKFTPIDRYAHIVLGVSEQKVKKLKEIKDQDIEDIEKEEDEKSIEYIAHLSGGDYVSCAYFVSENNFCCFRMPFIKTNEDKDSVSFWSTPIILPESFFDRLKKLYQKQQNDNIKKRCGLATAIFAPVFAMLYYLDI